LKYDVVVVGAGPGGSTTARFAAKSGLKVLIIDRRKEVGHPVQCGEFLPDIVEVRRMFPRCGKADDLFNTPSHLISLRTETIKLYSPKGKEYSIDFKGYTVDRRNYDKHLVELAVKEGAELRLSTLARNIKRNEVLTEGEAFEAKVIVGADGPLSKVAEWTGLPRNTILAPAITCQVDGEFEPAVKTYFGHLAPGGYAWIIPKKGCANVGLGVQRRFTNKSLRKLFDLFMDSYRFKGRDISGGHVPLSGPVKKTVKDNVLLVGDSAGLVMPSNGGGIPPAMICGKIAGKVISAHLAQKRPLEEYETVWRAAIGRPLKNSFTTKRMGDKVFGTDYWLNVSMRCLGNLGLARAIRCQRLFPW
jgi:digeranylgeranylglycerophospholipid reductase